jgi:hypothetical protein
MRAPPEAISQRASPIPERPNRAFGAEVRPFHNRSLRELRSRYSQIARDLEAGSGSGQPIRVNLGTKLPSLHPALSFGSMNVIVKIAYAVYRSKADSSLRLAVAPGARLPTHVKSKDWSLMPAGSSPLHTDTGRDVAVKGYCLFQVSKGK